MEIFAARDRKLEEARRQRQQRRRELFWFSATLSLGVLELAS